MLKGPNRVIDIPEAMALPEGTRVFVEMRMRSEKCFSAWHIKEGTRLREETEKVAWLTIGGSGHRAERFRIWEHKPKRAETEKIPWKPRFMTTARAVEKKKEKRGEANHGQAHSAG